MTEPTRGEVTLGVVPEWVPKDAPVALRAAAAAYHDPPRGARFCISPRTFESCAAACERSGDRKQALFLLALAANQRRIEFLARERGYVIDYSDARDSAEEFRQGNSLEVVPTVVELAKLPQENSLEVVSAVVEAARLPTLAAPARSRGSRRSPPTLSAAPPLIDPTGKLPSWAIDAVSPLPGLASRRHAWTAMGISRASLDRLIAAQVIPVVRQGSRVLIPRLEIAKHLARHAGEKIP